MPGNDNHSIIIREEGITSIETQRSAILLLVESLLHGLGEKATISTTEAIEIVERAVDVQHDHAEAAEENGAPLWRAHALLLAIAASLRTDTKGGRPSLGGC